jgi:predicted Rdx family selenoprotein
LDYIHQVLCCDTVGWSQQKDGEFPESRILHKTELQKLTQITSRKFASLSQSSDGS